MVEEVAKPGNRNLSFLQLRSFRAQLAHFLFVRQRAIGVQEIAAAELELVKKSPAILQKPPLGAFCFETLAVKIWSNTSQSERIKTPYLTSN